MIMVVVYTVVCLQVLPPANMALYQRRKKFLKISYLDTNLITCYKYSYVYYSISMHCQLLVDSILDLVLEVRSYK